MRDARFRGGAHRWSRQRRHETVAPRPPCGDRGDARVRLPGRRVPRRTRRGGRRRAVGPAALRGGVQPVGALPSDRRGRRSEGRLHGAGHRRVRLRVVVRPHLEELVAERPDETRRWMTDPDSAPHGGESLRAFAARVCAWLDGQARRDGTCVAITHGGVVKAAVLHALGAPMESSGARRRAAVAHRTARPRRSLDPDERQCRRGRCDAPGWTRRCGCERSAARRRHALRRRQERRHRRRSAAGSRARASRSRRSRRRTWRSTRSVTARRRRDRPGAGDAGGGLPGSSPRRR